MTKLYYIPPDPEIFKEVQNCAVKIWANYDDEFGYATKKIEKVKGIKNRSDNLMFIVAMFDHLNQKRLSDMLSTSARREVNLRLKSVNHPQL